MLNAVKAGFSNCVDGMLARIDNGQYVPVVTDVSAAAKVIAGGVCFCIGSVAKRIGGEQALASMWTPSAMQLIGGGKDLAEKNFRQAIPAAVVAITGLAWMYSR